MAPGSSAGPEAVSPSPDRPATVGNNASKFQLSRSARSSNPVLRRCNSERTSWNSSWSLEQRSAEKGFALAWRQLRCRVKQLLDSIQALAVHAVQSAMGPSSSPAGREGGPGYLSNQYMRRKARDSRAVPASLARRQAPRNRLYACQSAGRSSGSQAAKPIDLCAFSGRLRLACAPRFGGHGRPW